ncbi:hypothetical protein BDV3_006960 [Batrachochytrium dendrobatidis]
MLSVEKVVADHSLQTMHKTCAAFSHFDSSSCHSLSALSNNIGSNVSDSMSASTILTGHRESWLRIAADAASSLLEFQQLELLLVDSVRKSHHTGLFRSSSTGSAADHVASTNTSPARPSKLQSTSTLQKFLDDSMVLSSHATSSFKQEDQYDGRESQYEDQVHLSNYTQSESCDDDTIDWSDGKVPDETHEVSERSLNSDLAHEPLVIQSTLLKKLFPAMNSSIKQTPLQHTSQASNPTLTENQQLKKKLENLERDIKIRDQTNKSLTQENRNLQIKLNEKNLNKNEFEQYRLEQIRIINAKHEENMRTFRKERLLWERNKKATEILPNKRERQEIDALKAQLTEQLKVWKDKEMRLLQTQDRLNRKVGELTRRNTELLEEVKTLEQERANFIPHLTNQSHRTLLDSTHSTIKSVSAQPNPNSTTQIPLRTTKSTLIKSDMPQSSMRYKPVSSSGNTNTKAVPRALLKPSATPVHPSIDALNRLEKTLGLPKCNEERSFPEGKRDRLYEGGTRLVWHINGTMKQTRTNGLEVVYFSNGDYKTMHPDGHLVYWYNEPRTLHTTQPDGAEILQFDSGQIEKRYLDGTQQIIFPDQTIKYIFASQEEEVVFPDGKIQHTDAQGVRTIYYPNGTNELLSNDSRAKYYIDGAISIGCPDSTDTLAY